MVEEHGDQSVYLSRRLLTGKVEDSIVSERLSKNQRGLVVGVDHGLGSLQDKFEGWEGPEGRRRGY